MQKRKNWRDNLTVSQKQHLKSNLIVTRTDMVENRQGQERLRSSVSPPGKEVCWDCRVIAVRVGIED